MRTPRIAILVLFFSASLFLVCRSISSVRGRSPVSTSSPSQKSSFRTFFSFTSPFSLFPPSAAISLTDDNSTFFSARPAAFGPPLPATGLSGQLWIGSGFSDETLQDGSEGEGELGCSDIPEWEERRSRLAIKAALQGLASSQPAPIAVDAKRLKTDELAKDPAVDRDTVQKTRPRAQPKPVHDGTDDYLHQDFQQPRSPYNDRPTVPGSSHADIQSMQETAEITGKVALLSRGGCGFLEKVKWAQRRGAIALIVGDNQRGGPLIQMFARGNVDNVTIPSVFTSRTSAHLLSSLMQPGSFIEDILSKNGDPLLKVQSTKAGNNKNVKKTGLSSRHISKTSAAKTSAPKSLTPKTEESAAAKSWLSRLFHWGGGQGVPSDSSRPPSSGRLDWVFADQSGDENDKLTKNSPDKTAKDGARGSSKTSGDGFQIGVQDWRDPDLAGSTAEGNDGFGSQDFTQDNARSSSSGAPARQASKAGKRPSTDSNGPKGGSITPGSGEYVPGAVGDAISPGSEKSQSSSGPRRGLLSNFFGGDEEADDEPDHAPDETPSSSATVSTPVPLVGGGHTAREGLWVTIAPTGSASPFFDTLLVLVISPLITLTVVYALLILRVKIRMRRWRAPKSVVDRLPVRTYQTVAPSPTESPRAPSPTSSSPTTPLLQGSSRPRPRSRTTTGVPEAGELLRPDDALQPTRPPSHEKNPRGGSSEWKKYMGRQVECVVCLEEYVDGVSKVMSLPCGHEFHAECITPWLTTRRRTCPICKNDVVRSLARGTSSGPQYEPFNEDGYESNGEASETFQDRLPSPNRIEDLERGPSWSQGARQDWHASRNDVWFSALTSRLGGSSSFTTRREGSGEDRGR
ncbi:hypothetical protein C8A00DRAFT_14033 [Chaetomidium leptoderma]|uniref:RING-type E3 ubiquitin transferase n=1 Tax=Chaetomidium leptoderma TaxID=669021 RepID=A0AAN6ZXU9_9PEZI|nr:hypothetical protein C8A00DRAFT_14033 [Chaetomidium leptoderma]